MTSVINLKNVTKKYDDEAVVDDVNFQIEANEFVTILGPSGCGKTTTLRLIGGFEEPTSGEILFKDKNLLDIPSFKRPINTVFQRYALFPHMDIYENIAFGLRIKKLNEKTIKSKVKDILALVNMDGYERREIDSLSGGQQQRVAIARALVNEPDVLLLDEPLGALDLKLRKRMQLELKDIQAKTGITFIYVTHDQEEALTMSNKIIVMKKGKIQQIGSPTDIYNEPQNAFVADFIGESNIIPGIMIKDELVRILDHDVKCVDKGFKVNEPVDIVIRPEDIKILEQDKGIFNGVVKSVIFKGVHYEMAIETKKFNLLVHSTIKSDVGQKVGIYVKPFDIHVMKRDDSDD